MAGSSLAPEPRPLHVSRWDRRCRNNVSQRWFLSFSDHTDVCSHVHVLNQLSLMGDGDYRRGGGASKWRAEAYSRLGKYEPSWVAVISTAQTLAPNDITRKDGSSHIRDMGTQQNW